MSSHDHAVGPRGSGIVDEVLDLMLRRCVIGSSDNVQVLRPAEALFLCEDSSRTACPYAWENPNVHYLLLPRSIDDNHYVLLLADLKANFIGLYDSLYHPGCPPRPYLENLAFNIWGPDVDVKLVTFPGPQQDIGSNDCAVFVWRNVLCFVSQFQEVPILNGSTIGDGCQIDRDCFRAAFDLMYPQTGSVLALANVGRVRDFK